MDEVQRKIRGAAIFWKFIETWEVSLTDDDQTVCLCLFIKVLFTGKVIKIIYIHPVLEHTFY